MKKSFLIGMAVASFSLSAYAQTNSTYVGNKGESYSPQSGVSIQFAKNGGMEATAGEAKASISGSGDTGIDTDTGIGSGMVGGSPDFAKYQAQAAELAQAHNKPVDLRSPPEGAEAILRQGSGALHITDPNQLQNLTQKPVKPGNHIPEEFLFSNNSGNNANNSNRNVSAQIPSKKSDIFTNDISGWNKSTIEQFEKQGKERTENRYKKFLSQ